MDVRTQHDHTCGVVVLVVVLVDRRTKKVLLLLCCCYYYYHYDDDDDYDYYFRLTGLFFQDHSRSCKSPEGLSNKKGSIPGLTLTQQRQNTERIK